MADHELTDGERALIRNGEMIDAIKSLRNRTGLPLMVAKNLADLYRDSDEVSVYRQTPEAKHRAVLATLGGFARPAVELLESLGGTRTVRIYHYDNGRRMAIESAEIRVGGVTFHAQFDRAATDEEIAHTAGPGAFRQRSEYTAAVL